MKIKSTSSEYQSTVKQGKKMGFAPEAQSFLMDMMSDGLYSDKFGSIVREIASNCVDANTESGSDEPVQIVLNKPNSFTNSGEISFSDNGIGISPDRIDDIFTLYFASTKRDGNDMIGGFGIGAKSPFAYTDVFRVETACGDGEMRTYLMEKRGQDRSCTLLTSVPYTGPNGTTIKIPVKSNWDYEQFLSAINEQTLLIRPVSVVLSEGEYQPATVYEYEKFYVAFDHNNNHVSGKVALGNVVYSYKTGDHFDSRGYGNVCVIPKLEIGKVMPTMSRESIQDTDEAKAYIATRCKEVLAEIQGYVNDLAVSSDSIIEVLRANGGSKFQLPGMAEGHDLATNLGIGYSNTSIIKRKSLYLNGYETLNLDQLKSYVSSMVELQCEYGRKNYGKKVGFYTKNLDQYRFTSWITGDNTRYSQGDMVYVRKERSVPFTAAAKDYIKSLHNGDTTHAFFVRNEHAGVMAYRNWAIELGIYDDEGEVQSEKLRTALYDTFGKRFLVELMGITESSKSYFPTEEWIADRKVKMAAARKAAKSATVKDKANDVFRMRGLGHKGVVEYKLSRLIENYPGAIYLTGKDIEDLKELHRNDTTMRYQSFVDYVTDSYERTTNFRTCFFAVSEKTAKEFKKVGAFTDYPTFMAKRAARKNDGREVSQFINTYNLMMDQEFTCYVGAIDEVDPKVARMIAELDALKALAYKNGTSGIHYQFCDDEVKVTEVSYMSKQYSLAPLVKLHKDYMKRKETQPFLINAMSSLRKFDDKYEASCAEAYAYLYPNSCK